MCGCNWVAALSTEALWSSSLTIANGGFSLRVLLWGRVVVFQLGSFWWSCSQTSAVDMLPSTEEVGEMKFILQRTWLTKPGLPPCQFCRCAWRSSCSRGGRMGRRVGSPEAGITTGVSVRRTHLITGTWYFLPGTWSDAENKSCGTSMSYC